MLHDERSHVHAVHNVSFDELSTALSHADIGKKTGNAWLPVDIPVGPRKQERVKSVSFLVLDVESHAEPEKDDSGKPIRDEHGDIIKRVIGPPPPTTDEILEELSQQGWTSFLHTTYSHTQDNPRYRLVFDLDRSLSPDELRPLGGYVASRLGIYECFDRACLEPARLFFAPRCPEARLPLFRHGTVAGNPLPVDDLLSAAKSEEAALLNSPPVRVGVIDAFNAAHDVGSILEHHGYKPKGGNRWLWPGSTTGLAGVRLLPGSDRIYSSHGDDPLADTHAHDAFDCYRILTHGGDLKKAVREAARQLGLNQSDSGTGVKAEFSQHAQSDAWADPQPLTAKIPPEPYPLDALPDTIRKGVEDVAGFAKAPTPIVASSAVAAVSLACQAHIDAKRAEKLHGPVGLFLLTIADSGERKSTCDGFFTRAIRDYEEAQAEAGKPAQKDHRAAIEAWEAKRGGVKEKIRQLAKDKKPTVSMEADLRDLEHDKPEPPRIPRLIYADATPEALAYGLARQWPSGGVVSAEAGIVFGSHGMGKDSVMRNLGLLNQLWDGTSLTIDRRSTESFTVRGARLTVALQVQEPTLREFFTRSGPLARGTGFLARFLVAWPESTQGQRLFTEAPENWPNLAAFHRRITAILDQPAPMDEDGALTPAMLSLAPDAKAAWVKYHDAIESELASGGELYDVRDVASKSADNAARLAALFQIFEHGMGGAVGLDSFERASRIAAWHLSEARRFFGELALPAELADAARLDSWLIEHCRQARAHMVGKNHVRQHGPLRESARLDTAIRELVELDRVRLVKDGKRLMIQVNPALVVEGGAS
jgi:putative DNA primase/helicase